METRVVKVTKDSVDILNEAGALLRGGKLVAFPTETVYGLGANALNEYADYQIMISNDEILRNVPGNISMAEGFKLVDDVVVRAVDIVERSIESDNNNIVDTVKIKLGRNLSDYSIIQQ